MVEQWRVWAVARDGAETLLPGISGGSLSWDPSRAVWGTGSLSWSDLGADIGWADVRIRIAFQGAKLLPMGLWLPSIPEFEYGNGPRRGEVQLLDVSETANFVASRYYTVPSTVGVAGRVRYILLQLGVDESDIQTTPSTAKLKRARTWAPDQTWLTICNDLLGEIDYAPLHVDMRGRWVIRPKRDVAKASPLVTYGGAQKMLPAHRDASNAFEVPNAATVFSGGTQYVRGRAKTARDRDPASPWSIPNRGREISAAPQQVDTASLARMGSLARRALSDAQKVTRQIPVTHPPDHAMPLDVAYVQPRRMKGEITARSADLSRIGACMSSTITAIYEGEDPWGVMT